VLLSKLEKLLHLHSPGKLIYREQTCY